MVSEGNRDGLQAEVARKLLSVRRGTFSAKPVTGQIAQSACDNLLVVFRVFRKSVPVIYSLYAFSNTRGLRGNFP